MLPRLTPLLLVSAVFATACGRATLLGARWAELCSEGEGAEHAAEEFVMVSEGSDFGWPCCYQDAVQAGRFSARRRCDRR